MVNSKPVSAFNLDLTLNEQNETKIIHLKFPVPALCHSNITRRHRSQVWKMSFLEPSLHSFSFHLTSPFPPLPIPPFLSLTSPSLTSLLLSSPTLHLFSLPSLCLPENFFGLYIAVHAFWHIFREKYGFVSSWKDFINLMQLKISEYTVVSKFCMS